MTLDIAISRPILLFSLAVLSSAIITLLRYANFLPFVSSGIYDLVVNANGVRTGGALMSIVFTGLSYLTGLGLFIILISYEKDEGFVKRALIALSLALMGSLIFAFAQKHAPSNLGNTPFWVFNNEINSTFKDPNAFGTFLAVLFAVLLGRLLL